MKPYTVNEVLDYAKRLNAANLTFRIRNERLPYDSGKFLTSEEKTRISSISFFVGLWSYFVFDFSNGVLVFASEIEVPQES